MVPDAAQAHYNRQRALGDAAAGLAATAWRGMGPDFDGTWSVVGPRVALVAASAQLGAARGAEPYLTAVLVELGLEDAPLAEVVPAAFVGLAGDGRPVPSLLTGAVVAAKDAVAGGSSVPQALSVGGGWLDMAVRTLVADTGRAAVSTAIAARPAVTGWVRMLQLPSCGRCAVLAGRFYRWSEAFLRHPRCDCRHIPATEALAGDLTTDPAEAYSAGQVRGLTGAQTKALSDGADLAQVVNSRRGMDSAAALTTREAAKTRLRLSPEGVYAAAGGDRGVAVALLRRYGYLL